MVKTNGGKVDGKYRGGKGKSGAIYIPVDDVSDFYESKMKMDWGLAAFLLMIYCCYTIRMAREEIRDDIELLKSSIEMINQVREDVKNCFRDGPKTVETLSNVAKGLGEYYTKKHT